MSFITKQRRSFPALKVKRTRRELGLAVWLAVLCIPAFLAAQDTDLRQGAAPSLRIALSSGSFAGLNHNDVLAAIKTWANVILKQRAVTTEVETRISDGPEELTEAFRNGRTDAASIPTPEFLNMKISSEFVYISNKNNSFTEQYVILVHRDSGIANAGELRRRTLLLYNNPRMSLAPAWVATVLDLPKTESVRMARADNPSRTVLPVFFRQTDACVVTLNVFEIACELNPQLRKELRVLATSPEVVPIVFVFRPGYVSSEMDKFEAAMLTLHESPAGQQVLTMFQGDKLVKQPVSCLESSRQILEARAVFSVATEKNR